jgi:hypothetical protein
MSTETTHDNRAELQAKAGVEHIRQMMDRLTHAQEYNIDDEEFRDLVDDKTIIEGLNYYFNEGDVATSEQIEKYLDEDDARQRIDESQYGIQVRSSWEAPGQGRFIPVEYQITISGGGPASQISGELDEHNEPMTAEMQYQDWFTPWTTLYIEDDADRDALLAYTQQFYYGE